VLKSFCSLTSSCCELITKSEDMQRPSRLCFGISAWQWLELYLQGIGGGGKNCIVGKNCIDGKNCFNGKNYNNCLIVPAIQVTGRTDGLCLFLVAIPVQWDVRATNRACATITRCNGTSATIVLIRSRYRISDRKEHSLMAAGLKLFFTFKKKSSLLACWYLRWRLSNRLTT